MIDAARLSDGWSAALDMARGLDSRAAVVGYGVAVLLRGDGTREAYPFANLITDTGDAYISAKVIAAVGPAAPAAPTAATGMQIGSGSTAVAKNGAGAAMVTFLAGVAFDATYPQTANLGAGNGVNSVYRTTFGAGVGTGSVAEATITNGAVGTASTTANTLSRVVLGTPITKNAPDSLVFTWNWLHKGA